MIKPKIVMDAYRKAYSYAPDVYLEYPVTAAKFLEEYQLLDAIDEFNNMPPTFFSPEKPVKKAKEIALEAAVKINCGCLPPQGGVVNLAKEIYQWLTEPETDQR